MTKTFKVSVKPRIFNHVGLAFRVVKPKWYGDPSTRGKEARLGVFESDSYTTTFGILVDDEPVLSLNKADAEALGIALIRLSR